jgi:aryl-alcohol dehydrogenase-like predicted oxidoreductase
LRTFPFGPERRPLSRIVFGTFPLDGRDWGATDDALSIRAIHAALDAGIDAFDTAPAYGPEHSERILGRALREWPGARGAGPAPFIATKVGVRWNTVRYYQDLSAASVREECEASLRRLQVPVIDLLQIHWPHGETPLAETLGALEALRAEGRIRFVGVSNFDVPLLEEASRHATIDGLQPPYHLFMRGIERQILPWCRAHGVATLGYGVLCKGLLTGKFRDGNVPEDIRRMDPFFGPEVLPRLLPIVERLVALAGDLRITPGQLAMAYALSRPGLSAVIAGARTPEQARENAAAGDVVLDAAALAAVEELITAAPHVA